MFRETENFSDAYVIVTLANTAVNDLFGLVFMRVQNIYPIQRC